MSADFTGAYIECLNTISQQGKRIAELEAERDNYQRQFHEMHARHMADKERIAELEAMLREVMNHIVCVGGFPAYEALLGADFDAAAAKADAMLAAAPKPGEPK